MDANQIAEEYGIAWASFGPEEIEAELDLLFPDNDNTGLAMDVYNRIQWLFGETTVIAK